MAKEAEKLRFDLATLRELAGGTTFQRGSDYHRDGRVRLMQVGATQALASVKGTRTYSTKILGAAGIVDGSCTCPAYEDSGFCKHLVATALTVNAATTNGEDGDAASRMRTHLRAMDHDALVDMVIEQALRDPALFRRLDTAAVSVSGDDRALAARLREVIDDATAEAADLDYGSPDWPSEVNTVLDTLDQLLSAGRGQLVLDLARHAVEQIEDALPYLDEVDSEHDELLDRAATIHLEAAQAVRPEPVQFARELFESEFGSVGERGSHAFAQAALIYADVLGDVGLEEYRRLAAAHGNQSRVRHVFDFLAERGGDVDARIALRRQDLSNSWNYLQLADFCLRVGREAEALRYAEEGLWVFEDAPNPDRRLVEFAVTLLIAEGRTADAEAHLWRAFEKRPTIDMYEQLRKIGTANILERVRAILEPRMAPKRGDTGRVNGDFLFDILLRENALDAAWAALRTYQISPELQEKLGRASEDSHPREVVAIYTERVEALALHGSKSGYAVAADLVVRMARLRDAQTQHAYLAALKDRYRRRRNFIALLG